MECAVKHHKLLLTTGVSDEGYSRNQSCTLNYISAFLLSLWRSEHMINESLYYFLGLIFSSFVLTISFSSFFYSKHSFTYQSQYNYQPIWLVSKLRCIILSFICCIRRTGFWLYLKKIVTYRYIDDVLSLNNSRFGDFVDRVYPIELEIKNTTDTARSASYIDPHLGIDSEGRLRTKLYDKRDGFNFPTVNFPFIWSNITAAPAYGEHISQLIVVCHFVLYLLAIVLSVLLRFTDSFTPLVFSIFYCFSVPGRQNRILLALVHKQPTKR